MSCVLLSLFLFNVTSQQPAVFSKLKDIYLSYISPAPSFLFWHETALHKEQKLQRPPPHNSGSDPRPLGDWAKTSLVVLEACWHRHVCSNTTANSVTGGINSSVLIANTDPGRRLLSSALYNTLDATDKEKATERREGERVCRMCWSTVIHHWWIF